MFMDTKPGKNNLHQSILVNIWLLSLIMDRPSLNRGSKCDNGRLMPQILPGKVVWSHQNNTTLCKHYIQMMFTYTFIIILTAY